METERLKSIKLFEAIPDEELAAIAPFAEEREVPAETALVKDNNLFLPRANLGLAYLVHYDGKARADKALEYFQQNKNKADKGLDNFNTAAYLINLGVAHQARGDAANAMLVFTNAAKLLPPDQKSPMRDYLEDAAKRDDPRFVPWHTYADIPPREFAARAVGVTNSLTARSPNEVNSLVMQKFATPPASIKR